MVVWSVRRYTVDENEDTLIGIYSNLALAARAAMRNLDYLNEIFTDRYFTFWFTMERSYGYNLYLDATYSNSPDVKNEYGCYEIQRVTLNE